MRKTVLLVISVVITLTSVIFPAAAAEKHEAMKPALLVIDIQNQFLPWMVEEEREFGLQMINNAIGLFRQNGFPVIRVYHSDSKWGPDPESEAFRFPESVLIQDDDLMIIKNYPSAFKKTELEKMLAKKECNTVFLCGLSSVGCVLATYFGAQDRDLDVFMVKDALMSHKESYTDFIQEICDTVSWKAMQVMLENTKKPN